MNEVPDSRQYVYIPETRYRSAVSEAIMKKFGGIVNFLFNRHIETRAFGCQGIYNGSVPITDIDNGHIFKYNSEIIEIYIKNRTAGSGGQTTFNVEWKPQGSGTWTTIFDAAHGGVKPQILPAASDSESCGIGQTVTGFVAPVLTKTTFAAGDMIRVNLTDAMTGNPTGAVLIISWRPI